MKRSLYFLFSLLLLVGSFSSAFARDGLMLTYKDGSTQLIPAISIKSVDFIDDIDIQMWEEIGTGRYFDYFMGVGQDGDEVNDGPTEVTFYRNLINPDLYRISNPYKGWNGEDSFLQLQTLTYGQEYCGQIVPYSYIVGYEDFPVKYDETYGEEIYMVFPGKFEEYSDPQKWIYNEVYFYQSYIPGKVYLSPIYYLYGAGTGWDEWNTYPIEILFPGYIDNGIWIQFVDIAQEETSCKVNVKVNMGHDVSNVKIAVGHDDILDKLRAGAAAYVETNEDGIVSLDFSYANYNGTYRIAAIGYLDGEEVSNSSVNFQFNLSTDESLELRFQDLLKAYNKTNILGINFHFDWGYGSIMHIRDLMTEQMPIVDSGYDWYISWERDTDLGPDTSRTQFLWNYFTYLISTVNDFIGECDEGNLNSQNSRYLGMAYALRAADYLDMARMYEFLPNDKTSSINENGNDVLYLTVPIVTEKTTPEEAANNPRATRDNMLNFILGDLQKAESLLAGVVSDSKELPDLSVVYGLYSRLYMWVEDYLNASRYARLAINNFTGNPTTKEQWLSITQGFNDLNTPSWMWGVSQSKYSQTVQTGLLNWTSWTSNETTFGYASMGPRPMINVASYDRINDNDWRKLSFIAPANTPLYGLEPMINPDMRSQMHNYAALKFRPAKGNMTEYPIGAASDYPLMRIEEMYFNEAEAMVHLGRVAEGKQLLDNFMRTYRYSSYTCEATNAQNLIEEIYFQKAVELWGEGLTFFDLKRLGYSVTRNYPGTNFILPAALNTEGRPAWLNFCIVITAINRNQALEGWNNPDPSGLYN